MKTEVLVDYTVHYIDAKTGKTRRKSFRLESEVTAFLTQNAGRITRTDTKTVEMKWHVDPAELAAAGLAPAEAEDSATEYATEA